MLQWIKDHTTIIISVLVIIGFSFYVYGCEAKVASLWREDTQVNRQELQLELDQLIGLAQLRMVDLDRQELLRGIILQNALILVQGQPFNPVGLLTGIAAIYGVTQGGSQITKVVKDAKRKRKPNNGTV